MGNKGLTKKQKKALAELWSNRESVGPAMFIDIDDHTLNLIVQAGLDRTTVEEAARILADVRNLVDTGEVYLDLLER